MTPTHSGAYARTRLVCGNSQTHKASLNMTGHKLGQTNGVKNTFYLKETALGKNLKYKQLIIYTYIWVYVIYLYMCLH